MLNELIENVKEINSENDIFVHTKKLYQSLNLLNWKKMKNYYLRIT